MQARELEALEAYLRQISATPLLTRDSEILIARRIERHRKRYHGGAAVRRLRAICHRRPVGGRLRRSNPSI